MSDVVQLRLDAGGRCQCTGQCGQTHAWTAKVEPRQCRAPAGCLIVRKKGEPGFWQLAGGDLAFADEYMTDVVRVRLEPVAVAGAELVVCDRCRALIERDQK